MIKIHFREWLRVYLNEQLVYSDGLASRLVYEALEEKNLEKVWKIDRMLTVQNLPRETREGTQRMGERMLHLIESLYEMSTLSQYRKRINQKQSFGHPAIVFTIIGHHLAVSKSTTTLFYLYSTISSLVQNAVRGDSFGTDSWTKNNSGFQGALIQATEKIRNLDEEDFGIISPGLELAQMKHERVNIRIFMSNLT